MKKKIIIFIGVILVVGALIIGTSYFILNDDEKLSDPTKLGEVIKKELIKAENKSSLSGYTSQDGKLYYLERKDLTSEKGEYYLKQFDFETNKTTDKKLNNDLTMFCYLDKGITTCGNEKDITYYYDLSGNEVLKHKYNDDFIDTLIKYDNAYWQLGAGELKKDKTTKKIPGYDDTFFFVDYLSFADNAFLLFSSANEYYIYNIKDNSMTNTHEKRYFKFNNGYCFYSSTYYHIYDLKNNDNKTIKMNGLIAPKIDYMGSLDENKIYQISNETDTLEIYNMKKGKVSSFDLNEYLEYDITDVEFYDNKLYLLTGDGENIEYVSVDLDNIKTKEIGVYDYLLNQNEEIEDLIDQIKQNYHVNIKIKDNVEVDFPDFSSQALYNNSVIKKAIKKIDKILKQFPQNFFDDFVHNEYKGLYIYLGGALTPSDPTTQATNPVAYTLNYNNTYTIVLDSFYSELENTACHELMHAIENNLKNKGKKIFTKWDSLNPNSFSYYYAYNDYRYYEFTPNITTNNKVYFVSSYSYTYPTEDRAEIFGIMCSEKTNDELKKYPHLYKKAQAIKDELIANFPQLKENDFLKNY